MVSPDRTLFQDEPDYAGVLAPNVLKNYDLDLDFGSNRLSLLSPDHCDGKVIYWPAGAVAVVPMQVMRSGHIFVPVALDGKTVNAVIDTGAPTTMLMMPAAETDFGLTMGAPDTPRAAALPDRPGAVTYEHKFASLNFGGVSVSNLKVVIIPDFLKNTAAGPQLGSRLAGNSSHEHLPDLLIGMNVLRHLHVYIAYREEKLYITSTDGATPVASGAMTNDSPFATHLRYAEERPGGR